MIGSGKIATMKSLRGCLLAAASDMSDQNFRQAVILICDHGDDQGAMGLVINRPSKRLTLRDLLENMEIEPTAQEGPFGPLYRGGPVASNRVFAVYDGTREFESSESIGESLNVTDSRDLLEKIAIGEAPDNVLVAMGYSGWAPGQLEEEMETGAWWVATPTPALLFDLPSKKRWGRTVEQLGLDASTLFPGCGYA